MITKPVVRFAAMLGACLTIAACGGGGGGGGAASPVPPPVVQNDSFNVELRIDDQQLSANTSPLVFGPGTEFATQINVRITEANGDPVRNLNNSGLDDSAELIVTLSLNQGQLGGLVAAEGDALSNSLDLVVDGSGNATAIFYTNDRTGSVEVTASALDRDAGQQDPITGEFPGVLVTIGRTITIDRSVAPPEPSYEVSITRTSIPANRFGVPPFLGSPFVAEVDVTFLDSFGVPTDPVGSAINVTMIPVDLGAFSTLDDPSTNANEFELLFGDGPVDVGFDGNATFFVHSFDTRGEMTARMTAIDPETELTITRDLVFTINEPAADGRPANVGLALPTNSMYIRDSGGLTNQSFDVVVFDGAEEPVDDPTTNNNVLIEIFTEGPNSGETLRATGLAGAEMSGTSVRVATTAGVTNATFSTGDEPGLLRLRATADAEDNNVENGIQVPVFAEAEINIGDGVPYEVTIADVSLTPVGGLTSPGTNIVDVESPAQVQLPLPASAVYQMEINAIVTDRQGNPPARPATLNFGLLDDPVEGFPATGPGFFDHSGFDGNPAEGGVSFTALSADFIRPNGTGVGPDDTLVLFGNDSPGNGDLELARQIDFVISDTVLQVDEAFNLNNETGMSVDNGPALPWAVGRGMLGNVDLTGTTDENGIARVIMRYPVSAIGHAAILYAQGTNGDLGDSGEFHTYADVALMTYPGAGNLTLTASPATLPVNSSNTVTVCAFDAVGTPVPGVIIDFTIAFQIGNGTVDGTDDIGSVANPTGFDGCTVALVESNGVPEGADDGLLSFFAGGGTATVDIVNNTNTIIQVEPSLIIGDRVTQVLIRYLEGSGDPIEGVLIVGECQQQLPDGLVQFIQLPGVTDAEGETIATLSINGFNSCETPGMTTCEFTTATGTPTGRLQIIGADLSVFFSPDVCPDP